MKGKKTHRAKVLVMGIKKMCEDGIEEANQHLEDFDDDDCLMQEENDERVRIETEKEVYQRILAEINKIYKYENTDEFKPDYTQSLMFRWATRKPQTTEG